MHDKKRVFRWVLICSSIVLAVAVIVTASILLYKRANTEIKIDILGARELNVEVGETYTDAGAKAKVCNRKNPDGFKELEVTTSGKVDTKKLGDYELRYTASYLWRKVVVVRTVHVVDTTAPVITLKSNPEGFTLPGQTYIEEGFTAMDNHDGDLTALVQRTEQDGVVTYTVTDSSGNVATVQRHIVYGDPAAPVLTLLGDSHITMNIGRDFYDPGCTATDNVLGDVTDRVQVSGWVDGFAAGTYTLTYSATDDYENTGTVTRTVTVLPFDRSLCPAPNGKVIYLTFDDGPGPSTGRLLDILAKYGVKATFFVVNTGYYGTMARAASEGHTVAIHTATHRFDKVYASEEAYFADLEAMQAVIEANTGIRSNLIRFPGGSSNTLSAQYNRGIMSRLVKEVTARGYYYFDWNVDSMDAGGATTSEQVFRNVINGVRYYNSAVVLQHDTQGFSVTATEKIIIWGLMNGYTFLPITESSPGAHHGVRN